MGPAELQLLRDLTFLELELAAHVPFKTKHKDGRLVLATAEWISKKAFFTKEEFDLIKEDEKKNGDNASLSFHRTAPMTELADYGDYTAWNSLAHLEKTAAQLHPEFKNLWKWVKKTYPFNKMSVTLPSEQHDFKPVDMYNFLKRDMVWLLCLLKHNVTDELNKWKDGLKVGGFSYDPPLSTFNTN
jgi:hypothetical protein